MSDNILDMYKKGRGNDFRGNKSPNYNSTVKVFAHKDGRVFMGTQHHFTKKYELWNSTASRLVGEKLKTSQGWSLVQETI